MKKKIVSIMCVMALLLTACGADKAGQASTSGSSGSQTVQSETATQAQSSTQKTDAGENTASEGGDSMGKFMIIKYNEGEGSLEGDMLTAAGMAVSFVELNDDHTGVFSFCGSPMDITWNDDGDISSFGAKLYSFSIDGDILKLDMMGIPITFAKEGSETYMQAMAGANGAITTFVNTEGNNDYNTDQGPLIYSKKEPRHLLAGEKELQVDGGVLYYDDQFDEVTISYGLVYAKELVIPAEINGKVVTHITRLHGNIENLYLPYGIENVYGSFGDFEGVVNLVFGYGDGPSRLKRIRQSCCDFGHFKRDKLEKIVFPEEIATDEDFIPGPTSFGESYNLKEVINIPPVWKKGVESLKKGEAMLKNPQDYIHPQSAKVQALATEITKGLSTDNDKVYAICKWVVDTLVYDSVGYNKFREAEENKARGYAYNEADYLFASNVTDPDGVIDKKVAVCEGFSNLAAALCNAVGIPAVVVTGIISKKTDVPNWHAWNMIYMDNEWKHIDTTFCNKDFNADFIYDENGEVSAVEYQEVTITYEQYMANEELRNDYSWEDIQAINQMNVEKEGFDHRHYYYCLPALAMGADHIAYYIDGMTIPGMTP